MAAGGNAVCGFAGGPAGNKHGEAAKALGSKLVILRNSPHSGRRQLTRLEAEHCTKQTWVSPVPQVAELFAALLGVGSDEAGDAMAKAGVLQRTLALVLQFPFNNILHAQVPCQSLSWNHIS